jgi:hopanoid biosynthesis associated protein HpnK
MPGELAITGDDFGASREVNEAIEAAHQGGVLTGASAMVTGQAFDDAVARARALPALATGLHLVLCDGRAASKPHEVPELVDSGGRFPASPACAGLRYWHRRRALRGQLERELRAQLERALGAGLALHHVDGHHHLHMHPVVFELLLPLLVEYRVPRLRLVEEDALGRAGRSRPAREAIPAIFAALARRERPRAAARGVASDARVYGLRATGALDEAELLRLVRGLEAPSVEIYLHPSRAHAGGRAQEAALRSALVRGAVAERGYTLRRRTPAR